MKCTRDQVVEGLITAANELESMGDSFEQHVGESDNEYFRRKMRQIVLQMEDDGFKFYNDSMRTTGVNGSRNRE